MATAPETRTAVIVLKAKLGQPEEVLRYPRVGLRREAALRQLVLHRGDTVIGTFDEDVVARWYMEDG
jgi:hypothetical protein